jgi:HK97 family phage prohead protease
MRFYWPIAKVDAEQRMVWGYASTEALDEQGEIIKREALEAALGDYMRFANIREMHRPSAVGVAKEATIDDKGLYLAAKIVDDEAWEKVVQGVYKGFSIGGRVTARDLADRSVITGLALTEISVVDRPANPEAVFDCWKASGRDEMRDGRAFPFDAAMHIWACGDPGHHHRKKEEADGCIRKRAAAPKATGPSLQAGGSAPADTADKVDAVPRARWPAASGAEKWATADELAKVRGQSSELVKMVTELGAVVGRIAKQVEDIARTPLPPQTIAYPHGLTRVSKNEDIERARTPASDEDIVERFAKLSPTEQTMLLIKAAYRNPLRPGGIGQTDWDAT